MSTSRTYSTEHAIQVLPPKFEDGKRLEEIAEKLKRHEAHRKQLLEELKAIERDARRWADEAGRLLETYGTSS